jgi:methyl-accepting chemotaxis protein
MGIEQINSAISQMDEVTQQNAALVEEAAAAAGSMQEQATALAEVVSIFKVGLVVTVKGIIPLRAVERVTVSVNPTARIGAMQATTARRAPMVADGDIENWEPF